MKATRFRWHDGIPCRLLGAALSVLMLSGAVAEAQSPSETPVDDHVAQTQGTLESGLVGSPRLDDASSPQTDALLQDQENQGRVFQPIMLKAQVVKSEQVAVDLASVLKLIDEQNLGLKLGRAESKLQKTYFYGSLANFLPDIVGTLAMNRQEGAIQLFGDQTIPISVQTFRPQLEAVLEVYPGGRRIFETLAAKRRHTASKSMVHETHQEQLARATEDYYNLIGALIKQRIAQEAIAVAKAQVDFNQARKDAGVGTKLQLMQAKTEVARQEGELIKAEREILEAEQDLLNRLNLERDIRLVPVDGRARPLTLVPASWSADALVDMALENHPSLDKIRHEMKAIRADRLAEASDIIPSVTLRAYINGVGPEPSNLVRNEFAGLVVQTKLLDKMGLSIPLRVMEKNRLIYQKKLERQQLVRNIETDVVKAHLEIQTYTKAIEVAREAVSTTEESFRLADGRFRAGVGINIDVIEAEKNLTDARVELTQAILNYNRAQVRLLEAVGRLNEEHLLQGMPPPSLPPS